MFSNTDAVNIENVVQVDEVVLHDAGCVCVGGGAGSMLLDMDDDDLTEMGLAQRFERKRFMRARKELIDSQKKG